MSNILDTFLDRVLMYEGGYSNNANDSGNWTSGAVHIGQLKGTKYGISAASYPDLDIINLGIDDAKEIYKRDYWLKNSLDKLPEYLGFQLLDACIQHGSKKAIKLLQGILGVTQDGIIGPKTISEVNSYDGMVLATKYISSRILFYTKLAPNSWNTFSLGWMKRMAKNVEYLALDYEKLH